MPTAQGYLTEAEYKARYGNSANPYATYVSNWLKNNASSSAPIVPKSTTTTTTPMPISDSGSIELYQASLPIRARAVYDTTIMTPAEWGAKYKVTDPNNKKTGIDKWYSIFKTQNAVPEANWSQANKDLYNEIQKIKATPTQASNTSTAIAEAKKAVAQGYMTKAEFEKKYGISYTTGQPLTSTTVKESPEPTAPLTGRNITGKEVPTADLKVGDYKVINGKTMIWNGTKYVDKVNAESGTSEGTNTTDANYEDFIMFSEYLDGMPDKGAALMKQWADLAEMEIGDQYKVLQANVDKQLELYKQGQSMELGLAQEEKATKERYTNEDLTRLLGYAAEDRTKAQKEVDLQFAKAMSSAASGYLGLGVKINTPYGQMKKYAASLRDDTINPSRKAYETDYTRTVEGANTTATRNLGDLSAAYTAFTKRQGQNLKEQNLATKIDTDKLTKEKATLKAGLVAARKAEVEQNYMYGQLKKFLPSYTY